MASNLTEKERTKRNVKILQLIKEGKNVSQISRELVINRDLNFQNLVKKLAYDSGLFLNTGIGPGNPKISDDKIIEEIKKGKTQTQVLRSVGYVGSANTETSSRLKKLATQIDTVLPVTDGRGDRSNDRLAAEDRISEYVEAQGRQHIKVQDGTILIGSDAHYMPGPATAAHRAFVKLCRELHPRAVISNGDDLDGASISRWPRIGWQHRPTVLQELKACEERKTEIEDACGTKELYWPLGNHDARFETFLAAKAPEFQGVHGFRLKDHFPLWRPCWAVWINNDVVVKHRFKGGIHATHNNTLWSGRSIFTGHLHSAKVTPFSDYNGVRYGVDCGTLAQPYGEPFTDYTEDNPVNWRSGFVVATFFRGQLLQPELCLVLDEEKGLCQFRGTVFKV
jgi:hypothetical protein